MGFRRDHFPHAAMSAVLPASGRARQEKSVGRIKGLVGGTFVSRGPLQRGCYLKTHPGGAFPSASKKRTLAYVRGGISREVTLLTVKRRRADERNKRRRPCKGEDTRDLRAKPYARPPKDMEDKRSPTATLGIYSICFRRFRHSVTDRCG